MVAREAPTPSERRRQSHKSTVRRPHDTACSRPLCRHNKALEPRQETDFKNLSADGYVLELSIILAHGRDTELGLILLGIYC